MYDSLTLETTTPAVLVGAGRRYPPEAKLITRASDLPEVVASLAGADRIAVDTETTGLNPRKDQLRLLSLSTGAGSWVID